MQTKQMGKMIKYFKLSRINKSKLMAKMLSALKRGKKKTEIKNFNC